MASGTLTDGTVTWSYGDAPGPDRVVFEYSPDGVNWRPIRQPDALHLLARDVPAGAVRSVYFRLTAPTSSSGTGVFQAAVRVVAVAP